MAASAFDLLDDDFILSEIVDFWWFVDFIHSTDSEPPVHVKATGIDMAFLCEEKSENVSTGHFLAFILFMH